MPVTIDPEVMDRVAKWRHMETQGTMTDEERMKAILWLREKRRAAATEAKTSTGKTKSSKGPAKSADELLGELGL